MSKLGDHMPPTVDFCSKETIFVKAGSVLCSFEVSSSPFALYDIVVDPSFLVWSNSNKVVRPAAPEPIIAIERMSDLLS